MRKNLVTILLSISILVNLVLLGIVVNDSLKENSGDTQLSYAISGYKSNPEEDLINVINNSKEELNIAIYNLDNKEIAEAIEEAAERGVSIRLLADGENAENKDSQKILNELKELNIPIKIDTDEKMHLKLTIADNETVVTGSFNYTKESAEDSQEVLLTAKDSELASSMSNTFNQLWDNHNLENW